MTASSGTVALNPTWWRATTGFVGLGMEHILTGIDHMLFLLCLIIPLRDWRQVLAIVTTFTVAHSFTLIGSAFHLVPAGSWFPPFVETTIAASIVYMALENIMGIDFARRMLVTGLFGLVHGFGFSYGLQENLQFAGTHLLVSLFAFNIGIELGQLLVLAVMLPALLVVRRYVLPGKVGMIILSALVAQTGWQWMMERGGALLNVPWPRPSVAGLATLALWIAGILLAAGGLRFIAKRLRFDTAPGRRRRNEARRTDGPRPTATRFDRRLGRACGSRVQRGDCCESPPRRGWPPMPSGTARSPRRFDRCAPERYRGCCAHRRTAA